VFTRAPGLFWGVQHLLVRARRLFFGAEAALGRFSTRLSMDRLGVRGNGHTGFGRAGCWWAELGALVGSGDGFAALFAGVGGAGVGGPILGRMAGNVGEAERGIAKIGDAEVLHVFGGMEGVRGIGPVAVDGFRQAVGGGGDMAGGAAVAAGKAGAVGADTRFSPHQIFLPPIAASNSAVVCHVHFAGNIASSPVTEMRGWSVQFRRNREV